MNRCGLVALLAFLALASTSLASDNASLIDVIPLDGGCELGPTGCDLQFWDIQPGKKYEFILDDVDDCGDCGTDEHINVLVRTASNVIVWEGQADLICPGKYKFCFTLPLGSSCTFGIRYCTKPGIATSGISVHRPDDEDDKYKVLLRASTFGPNCTCPSMILGPECQTAPARASSWGSLKRLFR